MGIITYKAKTLEYFGSKKLHEQQVFRIFDALLKVTV
jgi:hypothetical protein